MSLPYNRHYATNEQRGHQLYYDQVLETYPISGFTYGSNAGDYVPGAYQADGSVAMWGKNCTVRVTNQYDMPSCCSTWAGAGPSGTVNYCPCGTGSGAPALLPAEVDTRPVQAAEMRAALGGAVQ